jgi:hypothetical protein
VRAVAIMLVLVGCATAKPKVPPPDARRVERERIDWLITLGRAISLDRDPPEAIAKRLGAIRTTAGDVLYISPADSSFKEVRIHLEPGTRRVRSVTIDAVDDRPFPSVPAFEAKLGSFDKGGRTRPGQPIDLSFTIDFDSKAPVICQLVASVSNDHQPKAEWRVHSVTLQIDARL